MYDIIQIIFSVFILIAGALFVYVQAVVVEEQKRKKRIPLFWENDFKMPFQKHSVKYRDGDNT